VTGKIQRQRARWVGWPRRTVGTGHDWLSSSESLGKGTAEGVAGFPLSWVLVHSGWGLHKSSPIIGYVDLMAGVAGSAGRNAAEGSSGLDWDDDCHCAYRKSYELQSPRHGISMVPTTPWFRCVDHEGSYEIILSACHGRLRTGSSTVSTQPQIPPAGQQQTNKTHLSLDEKGNYCNPQTYVHEMQQGDDCCPRNLFQACSRRLRILGVGAYMEGIYRQLLESASIGRESHITQIPLVPKMPTPLASSHVL
jgi:hypothetical protein